MTALEKKQEIMEALCKYKRWVAEGKPEYREKQYYYDGYHQGIGQNKDGTFSFNIQLHDSPDGDTWWSGNFKELNGGTDVEILEEELSYN